MSPQLCACCAVRARCAAYAGGRRREVAEQTLSVRFDNAARLADTPAYRGPDRRTARVGDVVATESARSARYIGYLIATNLVVLALASSGGSAFSLRAGATDW